MRNRSCVFLRMRISIGKNCALCFFKFNCVVGANGNTPLRIWVLKEMSQPKIGLRKRRTKWTKNVKPNGDHPQENSSSKTYKRYGSVNKRRQSYFSCSLSKSTTRGFLVSHPPVDLGNVLSFLDVSSINVQWILW